ncbi:FliM/FliN family flagellar motor switch protein [Escherichia coli]|uniref:FliM/FliN family flagellar motor switch protein n=1 Tax=Escherichia coli TaxID=562 RepID=UPI0033352F1F
MSESAWEEMTCLFAPSLADLLNIDDDTVIELDKLAGEPLDIKVNNILLGKAEVVVVNEKYGLRVLEFNTRDINDLAP